MTQSALGTGFALLLLWGCGGSSPSPAGPGTPPGTQTESFSGTASVSAAGACRSTGHAFRSGEGNLAITLVRSTDNLPVAVQVCHPTAVNHATECTVPPFQRIELGMTLRPTLRGGRDQVLTVHPRSCDAPGPAATVDYTVSLEHPN
jgi:hypothetical protein